MGKTRNLLTLLYSAVLSGFIYYFIYLMSLKIKMDFSESLFLIALVAVIVGIVVLISRNQRLRQKKICQEDEPVETASREPVHLIFSGFNSLTLILTGVLLLIVDVILQ